MTASLLRAHVRRGSQDRTSHGGDAGGRERGRAGREVRVAGFGKPEIEDFDDAIGADPDVRGFEIAMDDARVVG